MGIIDKGILGGFSGKVGTVVGGTWKGITYMRSKGPGGRTTFSQSQMEQHAKFAASIKFLQPMVSLLNTTFKDYAVKMTGFNNAMSYTLKNAITGTYPVYTVDYSLALVSRGDLPNALSPSASSTGTAGKVVFTWTSNQGVGKAAPDDKAVLVVYCPEMKLCVYTDAGPDRSTGTGELTVTGFAGKTVQTYVAFISADGRDLSNSIYTGQLTVS